jgi:4-hydroxyphenylpyruvate dioxygenase
MSLTNQKSTDQQTTPTVPLLQEIDYIELYVGNVTQAAHYFRTAFGFTPIAHAGLETGLRDRTSMVMQQGNCSLLLTAPLHSTGPVAEYVLRHGDGVKDIAFRVENVEKVFNEAICLGAQPLQEPTVLEDHTGYVVKATIATCGDVVHSLIQRNGIQKTFFPGYQPLKPLQAPQTGLQRIDHIAISLPLGELQRWVNFYSQVFGFHPIHEEGISTEYSAMRSVAVEDSTEQIKFVLVEPIPGKRKSQIEEFLAFHQGPGVQHVAFHTQDIIHSIEMLEDCGIPFISTPESYYDMLPERIGSISEDIDALRRVNVLVDRDEWGYLLQIFSLPIQCRPTLFIEIIQRKAARGFGSGNIQALFKALEREQIKRGNL